MSDSKKLLTIVLSAAVLLASAAACRRGADSAKEDDEWEWKDEKSGDSRLVEENDAPRPVESARTPSRSSSRTESTDRLERPAEREPARAPAPAGRTALAGSALGATLDTSISSATASVGQAVQATLSRDVLDAGGRTVLPAGTRLTGTVTEVQAAHKVQKKSLLAFRFDRATLPDGRTTALAAGYRAEGRGYTKKDGGIIGGSAAGGALLGQVLGGDTDSTAAGAVIGGAIGSGVVMSKKGEEVELPAGTALNLTLDVDVNV